jgi:dTDP-4-dehydrorhamnose reductase
VRVAVLGATGQLGTDLVAHFAAAGDDVVALGHDDVRVEAADSVRAALGAVRPDAVVNTAACHHLGRCEEEPERAFAVNALGARNLAQAARELGFANVYVSTDYVFDGRARRPYTEDDAPRPLSVYGASKLAGEHFTLAEGEGASDPVAQAFVIRVSAIYGKVPSRAKGDNFVTMITRRAREQPEVRVVDDEIVAPTPTAEIARAAREILTAGRPGLYHLACRGSCSWYELTRAIFDLLAIDTPLHRASAADFPGPARRPAYSVLDSRRYHALGRGEMPHWRDGLAEFLSDGAA